MAIDPDLFPLGDLDLDRLYANLVETEDTVKLLEAMTDEAQGFGETELAHYEAKLAETRDMDALLRELIARKRRHEMEKL